MADPDQPAKDPAAPAVAAVAACNPEQLSALISAATSASASATAAAAALESISAALAEVRLSAQGDAVSGSAGAREKAEAQAEAEKDAYDYVAGQISREDGLIHNRMTWTLQLNGFLFASLALLKVATPGEAKQASEALNPWLVQYLLGAIPFIGFVITVSGWAGVCGAAFQLRYLTRMYDTQLRKIAEKRKWPQPFGVKGAFMLGTFPTHISLFVVNALWAWLALHAIAPVQIEHYSNNVLGSLQTAAGNLTGLR